MQAAIALGLETNLLEKVGLMLLLAVGLSLLSPLLGGPLPPLSAVLAVLILRLSLQGWAFWQARRLQLQGQGARGPSAASLFISAVLVLLLTWQLLQGNGVLPLRL